MGVSDRFKTFLSNISLTDTQKQNGAARREAVVRPLNAHYWNSNSGTDNSLYVGSWAKLTRIRPPRDVDVLYTLPSSVYERFERRSGNRQSQLLQEIKSVLRATYSNTDVRGDGPVVVVPFSTYNVELIPSFRLTSGEYWVCMTDAGGYYQKADYKAEADAISASNSASAGNTRDLIRMAKCWQSYCNVPIKSFYIELLAVNFIATWPSKGRSVVYYDWMVRDFFAYMVSQAGSYVFAPGTYELLNLGTAWKSRAETAAARARKACEYEVDYKDIPSIAGDEWQNIFGTDIPMVA